MSSNLKVNCYGFATGCRKLCLPCVGRRKPKMVGKHWDRQTVTAASMRASLLEAAGSAVCFSRSV